MRASFQILTVAITLAGFVGCNDADTPTDSSEVQKEIGEALETTGDYLAQQRDAFAKEMQGQMATIDDRLTVLRAKADEASGEAKVELQEALAALEQECSTLDEHIESAAEKSGDAWKDAKQTISAKAKALQDRIEKTLTDNETQNKDAPSADLGEASATTNVGQCHVGSLQSPSHQYLLCCRAGTYASV